MSSWVASCDHEHLADKRFGGGRYVRDRLDDADPLTGAGDADWRNE